MKELIKKKLYVGVLNAVTLLKQLKIGNFIKNIFGR